ncbi:MULTISPECIES: Txe/YoeB family addiction module toxin [Furfurilactobacillus]|uniref:Endoribonuclease YoeB n=1 Tax=Furfurilactobacillus rossiae TaxID=231049 RepID=A0A7C9NBA7_9LACO|nr:Txe/YoeB family addiction module toxin [Furfurilactobacillus milii]MYV05770.1 Txe/YoeB family addiction module toxin [Furfurilactobacillus milii]
MIKFNIVFSPIAWNEYVAWQQEDKKTLKRINKLINDIQRQPFAGLGKPEPLTYELSGTWSRRIDKENQIVYSVTDAAITIFQLKYHY